MASAVDSSFARPSPSASATSIEGTRRPRRFNRGLRQRCLRRLGLRRRRSASRDDNVRPGGQLDDRCPGHERDAAERNCNVLGHQRDDYVRVRDVLRGRRRAARCRDMGRREDVSHRRRRPRRRCRARRRIGRSGTRTVHVWRRGPAPGLRDRSVRILDVRDDRGCRRLDRDPVAIHRIPCLRRRDRGPRSVRDRFRGRHHAAATGQHAGDVVHPDSARPGLPGALGRLRLQRDCRVQRPARRHLRLHPDGIERRFERDAPRRARARHGAADRLCRCTGAVRRRR